jgi:hypothetical protein
LILQAGILISWPLKGKLKAEDGGSGGHPKYGLFRGHNANYGLFLREIGIMSPDLPESNDFGQSHISQPSHFLLPETTAIKLETHEPF